MQTLVENTESSCTNDTLDTSPRLKFKIEVLKSLSIEFLVLTNFEEISKIFEKCLKYPQMVH